jgi:iron complex outermembrane recepter protein
VSEIHKRAVGAGNGGRKLIRAIALSTILVSLPLAARSQQKSADLTEQSLEDLMNIEVTSVSKKAEKLSHTAAAIFVITAEDIRRSGVTNFPDLLRMVPGMDVAQINANTWAITARGFNDRFSNELLVLVDGRPVYTQTFGGVFWDSLDLPLEDIERIEVIRGPGSTIWGSNAVNGVINIITKKTSETHGGLVVAGGGNVDQGFGMTQYGGNVGKETDYRVYAKYHSQDHLPNSAGQDGGDGWHMLRGGFRIDSTLSPKDTLTFEGDIYAAREGVPTVDFPSVTAAGRQNIELLSNVSGGFIQGAWSHTFSPHSDTSLQISYDTYERSDFLREGSNTLDLDFQHHFSGWARHNVVWGLTYRHSALNSSGNLFVALDPDQITTQLFGSFIQDEIAVFPERVFLTVGAKLEHNYYSGFNFMPSARLAWAPGPRHTLWAAVSKADRTPSAFDASVVSNITTVPGPGGIPDVLTFFGNRHVKNEGLIAYEAGYRATVLKQLSVDFTAYYNDYSRQETAEPLAPFMVQTPPPPHLVTPLTYANLMQGETRGVEVSVHWQPMRRWTLSTGYAFEEIHMHLAPSSQDTTNVGSAEGSSPGHSAQLGSHLDFGHGLSWDASAYFVGRLADPSEPSYTRLDTGLSWQFSEGASISFVGQNLGKNLHEEFVDDTDSARTTEVKRSAYAKFTWRF